jgi:release factor glutamine methyltransferase
VDLPAIVDTLRAAGCVFAEDEAALLVEAASSPAELRDMIDRRVAGLPLEHILGWAEFCGLRIIVEAPVFVPRQRTASLVDRAVALARPDAVVVDLCCGAGAIGAAILARLPGIELVATDIDPAAVRCARRNILPPGRVFEGDLFESLPADLRGRVDILVANTPYVPSDAIGLMPPEARLHEARIALDGGPDGLDVQRRVAAEASLWLAPGGHLLVETSVEQAPLVARIFEQHGLAPTVASSRDAEGFDESEDLEATVVIGTRR